MNRDTESSHPEPRVIGQNLYQYDQPQPNDNNEIPIAPPPYSRYPLDIPHPMPSGSSVPTGPGAPLTLYDNSPPVTSAQQQRQQQQQQQHDVLVLSFVQSRFIIVRPELSFATHIYLSCFVMWMINPLFGVIAYMLAVAASNKASTDPLKASKLGRASIGASVLGFVMTAVALTIVLVLCLPTNSTTTAPPEMTQSTCNYISYGHNCFKHQINCVSISCCNYFHGLYDSSNGYCLYN